MVGYGASMKARELFGRRIRGLRKKRGWSIEALATKAGINDKYLGSVERGLQAASLDTIEKIAAGLGVEIYELFVRDLSTKDLRARAAALLKEPKEGDLQRIIRILEAAIH
jgi:transcriptional regulator with XRE-family HTH domain